ncbi:hypothetical protein ACFLT7_04320 [candidate division KSB1 bacterium]
MIAARSLRDISLILLFISTGAIPLYGQDKVPVTIYTFPGGHQEDGMWTALHAARDGRVYVGLCTHGGSGQFYAYEPQSDKIRHIAMTQEAVNQMTSGREAHGKLHSQFMETANGDVWFGTDMSYHSYFARWDGPEAYPGGHLLIYDPKTDLLKSLGAPFPGQAVRVIQMDEKRRMVYVVAFPTGKFYKYHMDSGRVEFKGRVDNWDSIARVMVMDDDGNVYGSFAPYRIFKYDVAADKLLDLPTIIPHLEGPWCDRGHGHRENMWRNAIWHPEEKVIYGLEMGSSTLFRFDPATNAITDLGQFTVEEFQGERIVPYTLHSFLLYDNNKIYYAAPSGKRDMPCQLLSYDIATGVKSNLGILEAADGSVPTNLQGASIAPDGTIYFAGWVRLTGSSPEAERSRKEGRGIMGVVALKASDIK